VQNLSGVITIATGAQNPLVIKSDGTVWAWGFNNHGQLGDGTTTDRYFPVQVIDLSDVISVASNPNSDNSYALKADGTVWAWGNNTYGQLGDDTNTERTTPVQVQTLSAVTAIAAGGGTGYALKSDGTVWAWGNNDTLQIGDGTTTNRLTPVQVPNLSGIIAITAENRSGFALRADGAVWGWGLNDLGQLGDGTNTNQGTPVRVHGQNDVGWF
jgi:alpha-tubulin suppressor-like RCC1 family protein